MSRITEPSPRATVTVVCAQISMVLSPYVPCGSRLDLKLVDGVVVGARGASSWAGAGVSSASFMSRPDGNSSRASFSHHSRPRMRQPTLRSLKNLMASSVVLMVVVVKGVGALLPMALTGLEPTDMPNFQAIIFWNSEI
jgi:hypothetical protein